MTRPVTAARSIEELRRIPAQWRRRGLTPPHELAAIIHRRTTATFTIPAYREPVYADFFRTPAAEC